MQFENFGFLSGDPAAEEGGGFFGPGELVHEFAGVAVDGGFVAFEEIIIVASDDFGVNAEVVVFGNKEVLDF